MFKNYAPLFFLLIISSVFVVGGLYIKKDIETFAAKNVDFAGNFTDATNSSVLEYPSDSVEKDTAQYDENTEIAIEEDPKEAQELSFQKVTDDYFDDALFIGDSRTVGLKKYAMLGKASFFSETGMTIHNLFEKRIQEDTISEEKLTLEEVLTQHSYKKIYLMVGINELGRGNADSYFAEYQKVLSHIQQLQPDALFFIEGNMNVSKKKSTNDSIFNNINIGERNQKIASLEDKKTIFYIDINEVITDEEGYLIEEYTFDDIHLKAKYYNIWKEFLLNHGIIKG